MHVLLPVDGSASSQNAVRFVVRHFKKIETKPTITLYTVVEPLLPQQAAQIGHAGLEDYYKNEAERALEPAKTLLTEQNIPFESVFDVDWVSDALAKRANSGRFALIVMGSRGLSEFKSLLFGSVTMSVISKTKVPLILVRGEHTTGNIVKRIGIAIDDSQTAIEVMKFVATSQNLFGQAEYHLLHVVRDINERLLIQPSAFSTTVMIDNDEKSAIEDVQFNKAISRVETEAARLSGDVVKVKLVGNPADAMANYAHLKNLDMIVMGSHGRSTFAAAFVGSVVCRIATQGTMPLFIVR